MNSDPQNLEKKIIKSVKNLPAMPEIIFKIQKLLSDPNSNIKQIANVIETDQVIAVKVLKLANSSYYGLSGKVSSVQHAAVILGFKTLGELIAIAGFSGLMGKKLPGYGYDSKEFWKHSLAVALASKIIAEQTIPDLTGEAFTSGLIHDIGKIVLDPFVSEKRETFKALLEKENQTFLNAEKQILGYDHAEIASEICKNWKIPELLINAVGYHHYPSLSNKNKVSYLLHLGDYIAMQSGVGYDSDDILYELEEETMNFLGIQPKDANMIMSKVIEAMLKLEEKL